MRHLDARQLFPGVDTSKISLLPILDQFHEGVIVTDQTGHILFMNRIQEEIDDLTLEDVSGQHVTQAYQVDDDESPAMKCLKSGQRIDNLACFYRTRLGKVVNSLHNIVPLYAGSKLIGSVCFIRAYGLLENELASFSKPETVKYIPEKDRGLPRPDSVKTALNISETKSEKTAIPNGTRFSFRDIIGQSPNFLEAVDASRLAARSVSTVLLSGETGTGKELFAQAIHNQSRRKDQAYVAINCAAIPENLLEGVLFGTTRGAFTGAEDKPGLLEKAGGGTLFLDEINAMAMGLQAKLLRVLQERKVRRVGALDERPLDIKVISSVNEDPHAAVMTGRLRADLLYRLGVIFIRIPPLRERKADIALLAAHFLDKHSRLMKKQMAGISDRVLELFDAHTWHGNVRELEHVLEGAMNLAEPHQRIQVRHLAHHICDLAAVAGRPQRELAGQQRCETREDYEQRVIQTQLEISCGNVAKAARQMNLSPQTLHYKLKKYRIQPQDFKPLW